VLQHHQRLIICIRHITSHYITLHYMLHSKEEWWEPHSGANERLIGGTSATAAALLPGFGCAIQLLHSRAVPWQQIIVRKLQQVSNRCTAMVLRKLEVIRTKSLPPAADHQMIERLYFACLPVPLLLLDLTWQQLACSLPEADVCADTVPSVPQLCHKACGSASPGATRPGHTVRLPRVFTLHYIKIITLHAPLKTRVGTPFRSQREAHRGLQQAAANSLQQSKH
jgi:hypothetical protein